MILLLGGMRRAGLEGLAWDGFCAFAAGLMGVNSTDMGPPRRMKGFSF